MKFVVFSDFHAHRFTEFAQPTETGINTRVQAMLTTLEKVYQIAEEKGADVLFAGDLFHKRGAVDTSIFNLVFNIIAKQTVQTVLLRGNHDSVNNSLYSDSSLVPFSALPNVTVVEKPSVVSVYDAKIVCVPYGDEIAEMKTFIKENDGDILLAHIGVDGSTTGRYSHTLEGAFSVNDLRPKDFKYVALGHYHKRQFLGPTRNVFYVGNTVQTSFSDEGQDKGVMFIDTDIGGEPEFIPIANPAFMTLTEDNLPENIEEVLANNFVRLQASAETVAQLTTSSSDSEDFNLRVEIQKDFTSTARLDIDVNTEPKDITKEWAQEYQPENTKDLLGYVSKAEQALA
ncbi:recombination exonuclease [Brochothrix phage BtpYZU04]|uniref:Gp116 n=1 Tax=Brochothrix phage A9 TaxID=857312 RepID=D9J0R3_9CAUD|nr:recombination exonuclease [Brochothrix phage A9]ADJ53150.1 gp116 [Brochothrix phage A9]